MKKNNFKISLLIFAGFFLFSSGVSLLQAAFMAEGRRIKLENWVMVDGGPKSDGLLSFSIYRASFGLPMSGVVLANPVIINEIPTFDQRLITGFLFTNFFEEFYADDRYDIKDLRAYKYENGPQILQTTWVNDSDPFFTWKHKVETLPVEGYSVEFDALPDKQVDTLVASYQTPDFLLIEGPHVFYVVAKNTNGAFGSVGSFEVWVDMTEPTISDILPTDSTVVNEAMPVIQATLFDALSGIDIASVEFKITTQTDTYEVLGDYDPVTGIISYTPPEPLADGLVTVSLSVKDLAGSLSVPIFWSFTIDTSSPTGTVTINNGAPSVDTNIVTLQIAAVEAGTIIDSMIISNDGVFDSETWEPYVATKDGWALTPTAGIKTVYVKFRDKAGNESEMFQDSIILTASTLNTFIISAPPSITQQTEASFTYLGTEEGSVFSYKLDNGEWTEMDPADTVTFTDLALGNHYFQVRAGFDLDASGTLDPDEIDTSPAMVSWTIGTLNPSTLFAERPVKYYRRE